MAAGLDPGGWLIFPVAVLAAPAAAGLVAAWWTPRPASPADQRQARTLQGLAAGVVVGAAGAQPRRRCSQHGRRRPLARHQRTNNRYAQQRRRRGHATEPRRSAAPGAGR